MTEYFSDEGKAAAYLHDNETSAAFWFEFELVTQNVKYLRGVFLSSLRCQSQSKSDCVFIQKSRKEC